MIARPIKLVISIFSREKSYTERYRGYNTKRYEVHGGLRSSERFDAIDFNGYNFSINGYDLRWPFCVLPAPH